MEQPYHWQRTVSKQFQDSMRISQNWTIHTDQHVATARPDTIGATGCCMFEVRAKVEACQHKKRTPKLGTTFFGRTN